MRMSRGRPRRLRIIRSRERAAGTMVGSTVAPYDQRHIHEEGLEKLRSAQRHIHEEGLGESHFKEKLCSAEENDDLNSKETIQGKVEVPVHSDCTTHRFVHTRFEINRFPKGRLRKLTAVGCRTTRLGYV